MLTAHKLSKSFGIQPLLENVNFSINYRDRVGLIGPNGSGKTTLLRMLAGKESTDGGHVSVTGGVQIAYLPQGFELDPALTLQQVIGDAAGNSQLLQDELQHLAIMLAQQPDDPDLQVKYDRTLQRLSAFDPAHSNVILQALGLVDLPEHHPIGILSGGQKTRLALALVLLQEPDLLLLDEPTNYLDIVMQEWLEEWLAEFPGAALIVSHDRAFLDRTVTRILALDSHTREIKEYHGNYSDYVVQYLQEREKQWASYREQEDQIRRMGQEIVRIKQQAQHTERATNNDQLRRYAKKVARKAKSREKRLEQYLASEERVEKPARSWRMKLSFAEPAHVGQSALTIEGLNVGYPGEPALLQDLNLQIRGGKHVVLTGPNGSGKTTLLRTIAGKIPAQSGTVTLGKSVKLGYMSQEQKLLDPQLSPLHLIQRAAPLNDTDARSFLHYFLFSGDEPLHQIGELSFGERTRLALALLVAQGANFLLLDEPINHLDIPSRSQFEAALKQFEGTILTVVHDRYFINAFATDLWSVQGNGIEQQMYTH